MEVVEEDVKPGYKLTNVGWIPEDWKVLTLKDLFSFKNGLNSSKENYGRGVKFINVMEVINNDVITWDKIPGWIDLQGKGFKENLVEYGDILFNRTSETPEEIGLSAIYLDREPVVFGGFVIKGKALNDYVAIEFRKYFLSSPSGRKQIIEKGQGAVRANIGQKDLEKVIVALPSYKEQKAIAQVLTTWDKAIEKFTQLIALKQQKKKALMQALLTGKKRFPEFEGEWREYRYKDLLKVVKRPVKWNDEELYRLISVRRRSGGMFERGNLYGHQILTKDLRTVREGDFLISKMQVLHGASGLVTKEFDGKKISGSYIAVVAKDVNVLDISFLDWYSKMPFFYHQTYVSSYGVHIEKMTFDFTSFLKLPIKLPSIEEQKEIVQTLEFANKEILVLKKKLDGLKDQKKGLMQQLLTGKRRIERFSAQ